MYHELQMGPCESLRQSGYAIFPALYEEAFLCRAREAVMGLYDKAGRPHLTQEGKSDFAMIHGVRSGAGLVIGRLLGQAPSLMRDFFHPQIVDVFRETLGSDVRLEATGAGLADEHRNRVLTWHNHIGGVDEDLERAIDYETLDTERIRRLVLIIYLDGLSVERGPLVVHPRKLSDPLAAPSSDVHLVEPEGNVVVSCPPGTAVLLEERTWHAALGPTYVGFRRFVGALVAADWAPTGVNLEPRISVAEGEFAEGLFDRFLSSHG